MKSYLFIFLLGFAQLAIAQEKQEITGKIQADSIEAPIHIINVTQCAGGGVVMGQYKTSESLKRIQLINGKDITTESAITKAMYLLGKGVTPSEFRTFFETPLHGEMHQN